jgi:hypothetical protein
MVWKTKPFARWVVLPLLLAQLLLTGAAVPHCEAATLSAGHRGAAEHAAPFARPHRHWAWAGHRHAEGGHARGSAVTAPEFGHDRADPAEHDGDAIYLADAFGAVVARPVEDAPRLMTVSVALPHQAATLLPAAARHVWQAVRPPGDRLPTLHDRLPHVLRV